MTNAVAFLRRRQRGMSMIELLTVMTILGVVIVAVAPGIGAQLRNAQIRNAADAMMAGIQRARAEAIRRNERVRFSLVDNLSDSCALSSTAGSWVVSLDDPAGNCASAPGDASAPRIIAVHTAADGNTAAEVSATRADATTASTGIVFNAFGRPVDSDQLAQMIFSSSVSPAENRKYKVEVSPSGGVRMCDTQVSLTSDDPRRCTS